MHENTRYRIVGALTVGALVALGIFLGLLVSRMDGDADAPLPTQQEQPAEPEKPYKPYEPTVCFGCGVGVPIGGGMSVF